MEVSEVSREKSMEIEVFDLAEDSDMEGTAALKRFILGRPVVPLFPFWGL